MIREHQVPAARRHTFAVLLAAVLWGTTGTAAHFAPDGSSSLAIGLATFGFGGLILAVRNMRGVVALFRDRRRLGWLIVGTIGVVLYPSCYYPAMSLAGVAVGNVVALGSGPLFAAILEFVVERRRPSMTTAIAGIVAIAGIALLASGEDAAPGSDPLAGIALALLAGFGYALYTFASASLIARGARSQHAMAALFGGGAIVMLPWLAFVGLGELTRFPGQLVIAYLAIVPMAIAYVLFGFGLRALTATTATTLALLEPLVATVLAVWIVGERFSAIAWIGMALVAAGILLSALPSVAAQRAFGRSRGRTRGRRPPRRRRRSR